MYTCSIRPRIDRLRAYSFFDNLNRSSAQSWGLRSQRATTDVNSFGFAPLSRHALRISKASARTTGAILNTFAPVQWDPRLARNSQTDTAQEVTCRTQNQTGAIGSKSRELNTF